MTDIFVVSMLLLFLSKASLEIKVKYGFTIMTPPCNIPHLVYETKQDSSIVKCAKSCYSNPCGICGRFLWKDNIKTCMLHSATLYHGNNSTTVWGWLIFTQMVQECVAVGYDYDPETNTCLKYIQQSGTTWNDARATCQNDGGDLISITTEQKWTFVWNYVKCKHTLWIGLQGTHWLSGDVYTPIGGMNAQLNGHDSDYQSDPDQNCGVLYPNGINPLQDESCSIRTKNGFMCEVVIS